MRIEKEIARAAKHVAATDTQASLSSEALSQMASRVLTDALAGTYSFEDAEIIVLQQGTKKRLVKRYKDRYSTESILCQCIKQVLDNDFKIRYPNRNKISRALFGILPTTIQMVDFTIVRFDFKDYFNSISTEYTYKKYIESRISDRFTRDLVGDFCEKTKYAFAGLPTSNAIAEIIAAEFDARIEQEFNLLGAIFYSRYIDDSVLILNKYVSQDSIRNKLDSILESVFRDKEIRVQKYCVTKFNHNKYSYISKRTLTAHSTSFDFLGYEFWLKKTPDDKVEIQYGITQEKRDKYCGRLEKLIRLCTDPSSTDYQNIELLRHRIGAFTSREVYLSVKRRANIWKAKGFISNYGELRFLLETPLLHADTEAFLKRMVKEGFLQAGFIPYFASDADQLNSGYNLYHNMKSNKTLLLVDGIGYDYRALVKLCSQVGISKTDANGKKRSYSSLVREYLIRVKVGY